MGQSKIDQLDKIFKVMGSPKTEYWPEMLQMKNFKMIKDKYTNDIFREGI